MCMCLVLCCLTLVINIYSYVSVDMMNENYCTSMLCIKGGNPMYVNVYVRYNKVNLNLYYIDCQSNTPNATDETEENVIYTQQ